MITRNDKNKKRLVALTGAAAITLLVTSIAVIGAAQPSYQQLVIRRGFITSWMVEDNSIVSGDLKDGAAVRSSDIVDGQVNTADLANNAVTSEKIRNGEVKAEDLDPSIVLGDNGGSSTELEQRVSALESQVASLQNQVNTLEISTRLEEVILPVPANSFRSFFVPCNSDETLLGGGYSQNHPFRADNFIWEAMERNSDGNNAYILGYWNLEDEDVTLIVSALCGKIVPATTDGE